MRNQRSEIKHFAFFFFILIFDVLFLTFTSSVNAQEAPATPLNWQCMSLKQTGGHTVQLTSKAGNIYTPDTDAYVVECVSSNNGSPRCTTGDTSIDGILGLPGPGLGEGFTVTHNVPIPAKAAGGGNTLEGEAFTWTTDGPDVSHTYFAVQMNDMTSLTAKDANLKLSSFYPSNSDTNCVSLRWDPTGFVFDSKTLEPIPDLDVTIRDSQGGLASVDAARGEINPMRTTKSGQYTFHVFPGFYTLNVQSPPYTFPSAKNPLPFQSNPLFPYAAPKRFLPSLPVDYMLYWGGLFFEKPFFLMIRDIPVDPKGTPFTRPAEITDLSYLLDKAGNRYKFSGGTTHPDAVITAPDGSRAIAERGRFEFFIPTSNIQNPEQVVLNVDKSNIMLQAAALADTAPSIEKRLARLLGTPVFAQGMTGTQFKIEPILNYLAGYAYDSQANVVANATVAVYITNANKAFYQTTADATGFFRISSDKLPALPYYLVITTPAGKSFSQTTSQFAVYNDEYAANNGVDYGRYQADPNIPSYQPGTGSGQGATGGTPTQPGQAGGGTSGGNTQLTGTPGGREGGTSGTGNGTATGSGQTGNAPGAGGFWDNLFGGGSGGTPPQAGTSSQTRQAVVRNNRIALVLLSLLLTLAIGAGVYLWRKKKAHEMEQK